MIFQNAFISLAEKVTGITPLIPYYHTVSDERLVHICHVHPYKNERQFSDDVDFLCKRYQSLSLGDLIDFAKHGKKLKKGSFIITFDDGYSQVRSVVAPILFKKGIPAIFFLTADFVDNKNLSYINKASVIVEHLIQNEKSLGHREQALSKMLNVASRRLKERIMTIKYHEAKVLDEVARLIGIDFEDYLANEQPYLTSPQIRELIEMGFSIGAHSLDHPYFQDLPLQDQVRQTEGSLRDLKNRFGLDYSLFAFPHSDYSIGIEFFRQVEKILDLSFGTSGIQKDPVATNLQRINFEKSLRPAAHIVARQLAKKIVYGRSERMTVKRNLSPES
jgi:peptidoglycan/xylan/chitin deacetylase (PgdA/CDA1 family)